MNVVKGLKVISKDIKENVQREINFYRAVPTVATLFLTYRCNSRCNTCTMWKRPVDEEKKKEIEFDGWKGIIDKTADFGIRIAEIFGGNVLLRKELLAAVLRYLREKGFIVHLPTNQIGLDDDIAKVITDCVDHVYISVDGVGEFQDKIRGRTGASKRADTAISKLLKFKANCRTPVLVCNTTVSKYNVDILEQIAEYALSSGFDEIHYEYVGEITQEHIAHSIINGLRPTPYYIRQGESVLLDKKNAKLLKEKLKIIKKNFKSKNIRVQTLNIDGLALRNLYEGTIPHKKCYVERNEVTIDPSGNVVICPFINNYILGNLLNDSFSHIWFNEKHRYFRTIQNRGDIRMCRHCILGVQRNPSFCTSLKRIYYQRLQ